MRSPLANDKSPGSVPAKSYSAVAKMSVGAGGRGSGGRFAIGSGGNERTVPPIIGSGAATRNASMGATLVVVENGADGAIGAPIVTDGGGASTVPIVGSTNGGGGGTAP